MEPITKLLWERSEQGLVELARRFGRRLYQTALNIIGIREDAEEAVNDTYLAVWNVIPPQKPEPLAPYVYRIGRNIALNRVRANAAQKRCGYDVPLDELAGAIAGPDLWETLDARALGQAIDRWLDTLKRESRVLFLRRYWFGDSIADISAQMGIPTPNIYVHLYRLREQLKEFLKKEGFL